MKWLVSFGPMFISSWLVKKLSFYPCHPYGILRKKEKRNQLNQSKSTDSYLGFLAIACVFFQQNIGQISQL